MTPSVENIHPDQNDQETSNTMSGKDFNFWKPWAQLREDAVGFVIISAAGILPNAPDEEASELGSRIQLLSWNPPAQGLLSRSTSQGEKMESEFQNTPFLRDALRGWISKLLC